MGTNGITNIVNDLNLVNVDIPKNNDSNGEFAKTFENVSALGDLEAKATRELNINDELKTSQSSVKDNYLKETNGKKFEDKVDRKINSDSNVKSDNNVSETKEIKNIADSDDEKVNEAVEEAVSCIVNAYCETLNISLEDFQKFMADNGITDADLLNPEMVQTLVMKLNDISDMVDIITDDSLFDSIKNLENVVNTNLENIPDGEKPAMENLSDSIPNIHVGEVLTRKPISGVNLSDYFSKQEINENTSDEIVSEIKPIVNDDENKVVVKDVNENNGESEEQVESLNTPEIKTQGKKNEKSDDNSQAKDNGANLTGNVKPDFQIQNDLQVENREQASFAARTQEIYDQIGEYIRNLSTEDVNEVQIRLQPETLGTIQVKVTQSEGMVKAEFVTNSENVKAVIEGQLIQLKQDFEESGIKVSEVEVRVSTNEFNENTQQDSRDEANERAARPINTRRINISDIGDLDEIEEYEDEEKIAVEMMTANGNSMDYRA